MWTNYDSKDGDDMNNSKSRAASTVGSPEVWEHITLKLLEYQSQSPQGYGPSDVFAVTCVEPLPEYGLQDGDGPEGWTMTADCLHAIGHSPLHVLEIWSTWAGAAAACRDILTEAPETMDAALMVVPYMVQHSATADHRVR